MGDDPGAFTADVLREAINKLWEDMHPRYWPTPQPFVLILPDHATNELMIFAREFFGPGVIVKRVSENIDG